METRIGLSLTPSSGDDWESEIATAQSEGYALFEADSELVKSPARLGALVERSRAPIEFVSVGTCLDRSRSARFYWSGRPFLETPEKKHLDHAVFVARSIRARTIVWGGHEVEVDDRESVQRRLAVIVAEKTTPEERFPALADILADRGKRVDAALETICRAVHATLKANEGLRINLASSAHPLALLGPRELELLSGELRGKDVGYWHDTAVVYLRSRWGHPEAGLYPNLIDRFCKGAYVGDVMQSEAGFWPGSGVIGFPEAIRSLPPGVPRVLKLKPAFHRFGRDDARGLVG